MFLLVNYLAVPINSMLFNPEFVFYSSMVENILAGAVAVLSGFVADILGRKRLAVMGFVLLGLGYACLGLLPQNVIGWWLYTGVDAIAWGIFYTIFVTTLWGDLAQERNSEKYYALGSLPFIFSIFIPSFLNSSRIVFFQSSRLSSFAMSVMPTPSVGDSLNSPFWAVNII